MRILLVISACAALAVGCGITFKTQTLSSHVSVADRELNVRTATVFKDISDEVWGLEKDDCKDFRANTEIVRTGAASIELEWNKTTCDWIGMGFGWNAWQPKDIRDELEGGEIEFYLRAVKGEASIPVIVALLEDYSGVQTAAVFNSSHITSYPITEEWQRCAFPMSLFPWKEEGLDPTNVKQLIFQFEGGGHILLDDMSIKPATGIVQTGKKNFGPSVVDLAFPVTLFDDEFKNVWGLETNECRSYEIKEHLGQTAVSMKWDEGEDCQWMEWGTSWTSWLAVDFTGKLNATSVAFNLYELQELGDEGELWIGIENYGYDRAEIKLDSKYVTEGRGGWRDVIIPMDELFAHKPDFNLTNVKQLYFRAKKTGDIMLDNIQIISR